MAREKYYLYRYEPSLVAAVIFVVLFGISTILHIFQAWRSKSRFLIPFIIGGLFETIGYIGRILSSHDRESLSPFILQTLLILLGPALFAASIYMILGRVIILTNGEKFSLIRQKFLTKLFVTGDVLSFLMQCAGGGIMAVAKDDQKKVDLGQRVVLAGLFVQIFFFGFFLVTAIVFQLRARKHLTSLAVNLPWMKHLNVLYGTSVLILIRSVFRVIEYIQGNNGYLLRSEVFLYVFDAVLMLAVMVSLNGVHPGEIAALLREKSERGSLVELGRPGTEAGKGGRGEAVAV
ncbi:RTA1-domain-containing protein [Delitschia confertaspora ATCC 74209]|uniref:RTA1-domain-containing protein n=1 Tax=Delitschia confertaspora ATCC 74209 TaxID=1513339 RepID=A0A9P4MN99_9PLEO|nr:RTA1-domain-containing protein [Delitschia confertaspora ATCC 74209]